MNYHKPWRQAILLSALIHCILLGGIGLLSVFAYPTQSPVDTIEMELVNETNNPANDAIPSAEQEKKMTSTVASTSSKSVAVGSVQTATASSDIVGVTVTPEFQAAAAGTSNNAADQLGTGTVTESPASVNSVILPPRILRKIEPPYPDQARMQGLEGTVLIKLEVLSSGMPGDITVKRSSGYSLLDAAAIQAVRQWRFIPAKSAGTNMPVDCITTISLVFRLD